MEITASDKFTPPQPLITAVLFLVFNRLDTTKQVFDTIRQAKPPRLYVAADGARANKEGEADKAQAVRDYIMQNVDWECEVKTLFRDENLGCKYGVSGAIDWFFENEEMGIILEDDCLPSQSFFWFCEELLEKYKDDMRVWHIGGYLHNIATEELKFTKESYFFSKYTNIWGWATWKNRWQKYDVNIVSFLELKNKIDIEQLTLVNYKMANNRLKNNLEHIVNGMDTWDHQWWYTVNYNNGLVIKPKSNLIENIGIGHENATHTRTKVSQFDSDVKNEIMFPIIHPSAVIINYLYDYYFVLKNMNRIGLLKRINNKVKNVFSQVYTKN